MRKQPSTATLPLDERLRDSRRQATSMSMPLAVHHRLDVLTGLATDVNATRAEIIAMLIAHADVDVEQLEKAVLAYRKMTVGDVVPTKPGEPSPEDAGDNVVKLPLRQPGRPRQRSAG
jgi:predicted DNA-binding protein